jgi:hypothetical protein
VSPKGPCVKVLAVGLLDASGTFKRWEIGGGL